MLPYLLTITIFVLLFFSSDHAFPLLFTSFNSAAAIHLTIDYGTAIGSSQFSPGITHVDNNLAYPWSKNSREAVTRVKELLKQAVLYENTHSMAWGAPDPWPDPMQTEPGDWSYLDGRLRLIHDTGGIPVITLCEAPWWMKGQRQADGTTRLLTAADEWADIAYDSRILDNKMDAWLHLVQRIAERYMLPPYNVRYFQVWNELKGYYNPITNAYDYTDSPGNPKGPNATHGYTYMYNRVYERLMQVAAAHGIATNSIHVGGPYVPIETWSSANQSSASTITTAYGTYDQRPLDVVQYWLQHKAGAGFIALDGSNTNRNNVNIADPFVAAKKFADTVQWIRSLDRTTYPGAATLPIWWSEWYVFSNSNTMTHPAYDTAIKAYALIQLIKAGGATALAWGGSDLWTATTTDRGGQPLGWYPIYKAFKDDFAPGTQLYHTTASDPTSIETLASDRHIMLVNKTDRNITIYLPYTGIVLTPYQVKIISYSP